MVKGTSGLKREIKRAKLFEVQRLVRRLRQLANKKGSEAQIKKNQRKIQRFEKELEFLKEVTVDEVARKIASENDNNGFESDQAAKGRTRDSHVNAVLQKRALGRIVNSNKVKEYLKRVNASSEDFDLSKESCCDAKNGTRIEKQKKTIKEKSESRTTNSPVSNVETKLKKEAEDDEHDNVLEGKLMLKRRRKPANPGKPTFLLNDNEDELNSSEGTLIVKTQQKAANAKHRAFLNKGCASAHLVNDNGVYDDSFTSNSDLGESDLEEAEEDSVNISSLELKLKGLESCFVETMSGLKGEKGSRGRSKQGKEKGKFCDRRGKRNRKGQRARQQMWEKIHGKSAKHLHRNKSGIMSKEKREDRKQTSKVKAQHSVKQKNDKSLHPSWEAMKRKRLQETVTVEFKGQKIKFDDSD